MNEDLTSSSGAKRTRALGEVLDYLLREFDVNHNPPPDQRKLIANHTGMLEKAVRIWFQNRRAKLRKVEKRNKDANGKHFVGLTSKSVTALALSPLDINEKYSLVDCLLLSVGLWQRVKTGQHDIDTMRQGFVNLLPFVVNQMMTNVDLLVILSKKNYEINYFFSAITNNLKILFRIFYPVSLVVQCLVLNNHLTQLMSNSSELRVVLSAQPKFSVYFFNRNHQNNNQWLICDDFLEGQQVSQAITTSDRGASTTPHVIVGLKLLLLFLNAYILENNQMLALAPPTSLMLASEDHQDHQPYYDDVMAQLWADEATGAGAGIIDSVMVSLAPPLTTNATAAPSLALDTPNFGPMTILHGLTADEVSLAYSPMLPMDENISPQLNQLMGVASFDKFNPSPDTPDFIGVDSRLGQLLELPLVGQLDQLTTQLSLPAYTHTLAPSGEYPTTEGLEFESDIIRGVAPIENTLGPTPTASNLDSYIDFGGY